MHKLGEETLTPEHYYYWRSWICYCKLTITAGNEDVWQGRADHSWRLTQWPQQLTCCSVTTWSSTPEVAQVSLRVPAHPGHTEASPPTAQLRQQQHSVSECSTAPEPPASITKLLLQQSWDPAQGRTCPQPTARGFCIQLMNLHVLEYNWYKKWPTSQWNDETLLGMFHSLHLPFLLVHL